MTGITSILFDLVYFPCKGPLIFYKFQKQYIVLKVRSIRNYQNCLYQHRILRLSPILPKEDNMPIPAFDIDIEY